MIPIVFVLLLTVLSSSCMTKKRTNDQAFEVKTDENKKLARKEQAKEFLAIFKNRSLQPALDLLVQGAFVNFKEERNGCTPLHYAAQGDDMSGITSLITHGADMEQLTDDKKTPLQIAVEQCRINAVKTLLVKGANSNHLPDDGEPLMHKAIRNGSLGIVTLLVRWGADLTLTNKEGQTALTFARLQSQDTILSYLASTTQQRVSSKSTVQSSSTSRTTVSDLGNHLGQKLLELFKKRSLDLERAKSLLASDEELVKAQDDRGFTSLHYAAQNNDLSDTDWLVENNADKEAVTSDGVRPLESALATGKSHAAGLLIIKGASLGWVNNEGDSPLHIAIKKGNVSLVKQLVEKNHSLTCRNNARLTPFLCAVTEGQEALVAYLLPLVNKKESTPEKWTALHLVARRGTASLCELLIRADLDVEAPDDNLMTPLQKAAQSGNEPVVRCLLEHQASVFSTSKQSYSPLHYAAEGGYATIVGLLLDKKAPIEGRTSEGFTPLHLSSMNGRTDASDILVKRGASLQAPTFKGLTAHQLAEQYELTHPGDDEV